MTALLDNCLIYISLFIFDLDGRVGHMNRYFLLSPSGGLNDELQILKQSRWK